MSWRIIRELIWILAFGIMLLFMFPGWSSEIILKPEAVVTGDVVRLSSIAEQMDGDIANVILMPSPGLGDELLLTAEDVRQILARRGIFVDVKGKVYVHRDVEKVSSEELRAWLLPRLADNGFVLQQETLPVIFAPRDADMNLTLPQACSSSCYAYVRIKADGFNRTVPIRVGYDLAYKVWMVNRDILPGERIKERDVVLVEKKGLKGIERSFSYNRSPIGYVVRHPLRKGQILMKSDVRLSYIIRKGQRVRVVYRNKGIYMEIPGLAKENGRPGDVIKVQNLDTEKVFFAKVIGESLVEVCI